MVTPINNFSSNVLLNSVKQQQSDFAQFLAAQLNNQDPFSPVSISSILQQQFGASQLQGQSLGNFTLSNISNSSTLNLLFSVSSAIGTSAQFKDNNLNLTNGQGTITYKLDTPATKITIDIFDSTGKQITSSTISSLGSAAPKSEGDNTFNLNTLNATLNGNYTYSITAQDSNKEIIGATPFATSQIQSSILNQGNVFIKMTNNQVVDSGDILQLG
jgi:flagellar basal-body rod modification protein FlgD